MGGLLCYLQVLCLLGIGSGILKVLGMDLIMNLPIKVSTTTSNFMIGVTADTSSILYLKAGYIDFILLPFFHFRGFNWFKDRNYIINEIKG